MGKKSSLGKFIAFTTAIAAIGGVCYIFRDKIKESAAFKSASDKAGDIYDSVKNKLNAEDDLFFDDWDDEFEDEDTRLSNDNSDEPGREYTTISSMQSEPDDSTDETSFVDSDNDDDISIPTIDLSSSANVNSSEEHIPEAYENEGLSDTSDDPDVLEEQDKLDF